MYFCAQNILPAFGEDSSQIPQKKRRLLESYESCNNMSDGRKNICVNTYNNTNRNNGHLQAHISGRHFIHLKHLDDESLFQTEEWQPSGSALFFPLSEDVMINTRNIEQFSYVQGNFFVANHEGLYSNMLAGQVLHLWRFCPERKKLFISRSILFKNFQLTADGNQIRRIRCSAHGTQTELMQYQEETSTPETEDHLCGGT